MINIAVVEDSPKHMSILLEYLERWKCETGTDAHISAFTDGALLLEGFRGNYDIILMDIEMPLTDGMSAAEEIRKTDSEVTIIFTTVASQYAIRGYAVEAFDYILKPVSYFALSERLNKVCAKIKKKTARFISINVGRTVQKINTNDICYIEIRNHTLIFHTADGDYEVTGSMREIEKKFDGLPFCRANSCYLINLKYVDAVRSSDAIVRGEKLLISRRHKTEFMNALMNYIGGSLG
jgi:DNA-binding LytR/AlgR family response regulator